MCSTSSTGEAALARPSAATTPRDLRIADQAISIAVESVDGVRVLKIAGELDIASRELVVGRCTERQTQDVVVDLSELTFLDCGGYRAFLAARTALEQHRRTFTLVGAVGEPRRLLDLIRQIDPRGPSW